MEKKLKLKKKKDKQQDILHSTGNYNHLTCNNF